MKKFRKFFAWILMTVMIVSGLFVPAAEKVVYAAQDYSLVFDGNYYLDHYADLKAAFGTNTSAALQHFKTFGMREGRQAKSSFDVNVYRSNYADLRAAFGNNLPAYYEHYITFGYKENRSASAGAGNGGQTAGNQNGAQQGNENQYGPQQPAGNQAQQPSGNQSGSGQTSGNQSAAVTGVTALNGVDYSKVFDASYYLNKYADLKAAFGTNGQAALGHFVTFGMREGRQASASFDVQVYKNNYADLRAAFGGNLPNYYMHYISYGYAEKRNAAGSVGAGQQTAAPAPAPTQPTGGHIVCIDAGHQQGGISSLEPNGPGSSVMKAKLTTGTAGCVTGAVEYQLNLTVSLLLKQELINRGYQVIMIRENNNCPMSNAERAVFANNSGAEIFVRVHANSSANSGVSGAMAYAPTAGNPYMGAALINSSNQLTSCVLNQFCATTGAVNRGLLQDDTMTGINWCKIPVTIIEMGFMSNPTEDRLMQDPGYQAKMAQGIANGIDAYFGK